ncbi:hypothetical protein HF1_02800 [Mycoplasma haemofelis str. Langford 1]|uniref:Uncharacterized protein n=1 Tax=Mycoplasma haemofelis (strain Langford 1) TaxID=941640 RepID=E8ZGL7_MYCHL|nr:hypothetical protein [Mycoplasma haemofelis]CBY92288.1 hypothetical protein HF1_02800 [Mycoplasma haemofelis str. Langford 1]
MTPATKIASAIAAASTASAGGIYFGTDLLKKSSKEVKSTIASLIQKSNPEKRLLTSSTQPSDKAWKDAWAKYRNQNKESNSWGISSWTKTNSDVQGDADAPNDFISKCASQSSLEVLNTDDSAYKEVLSYCTRDTLIKDLISGSKRLLVNSGNEDSEAWNTAWKAYKAKNTGNQQAQDKWALGDWNSQSSQGTAPTTFKQKCVDKSSSNAYSQSSLVEDYELVLEWCTTNV